MKPKAGIVGPKDSVKLINEIASEYNQTLDIASFTYKKTDETVNILKKNKDIIDLWLFAGPALYNPAKKSGVKQPFYYLKLDGASLTKTLVEIIYKDKKNIERVSIDMLTKRDVYETYRDLNVPAGEVYVHEYSNDTPIEDLLNFHLEQFHNGKVDICITCLYSIYEELRAKGIPAYWLSPIRANIRDTLKTAIQQWETNHFKQSQIAALLISVAELENKGDNHAVPYDLHRLNLKVQSAIINFSELISGSFMNLGNGKYIIFSTRGSLSEHQHQINGLLERLTLITTLPSNVGIGFSDTALGAEENAWIALNHAQSYDDFCAFLVENNGTVEGPLKSKENITFKYRTENKEVINKLKNSGVTISTYNKLLSVQSRMNNKSLTANEIADWLKMTPRNARRILTGLLEQGIAEKIGEESPGSKGRPRAIYKINEL